MAKRPLTPAEVEQRRRAGKLGGRPPKPVSTRAINRIAKERAAVARARGLAASVQEEVVRTLVSGMRGMLPGSTADSMIHAAESLAKKGGLHDVQVTKLVGDETRPPVQFRVDVDTSQYPPATGGPADDPGAEQGPALET